jgi:hypothetical protein
MKYPERGYILDRGGKLLVADSYDIMVIPEGVKTWYKGFITKHYEDS